MWLLWLPFITCLLYTSEISVDDGGELYVHFWNSDEWSIQTEQELFSPKLADGLPELCLSLIHI